MNKLLQDTGDEFTEERGEPRNSRMSVRAQIELHQALARRRMQQSSLNEPEDKMVFLEAADEFGLCFGQAAEYMPFSNGSADEHTS